MRARDNQRRDALRLALAELKRVEVDERIELDDARVLAILTRMIKQRRDSLQQFTDAGRNDLAEKESFEIGVLESFLPAQMSDTELDALVEQAIAETGASGMQDMGRLMGWLKPKAAGKADMGELSKRVKARLG